MTICPLCQNKQIPLKHEVDGYKYYFCQQCQVLFLSPKPKNKGIREYYSQNFTYTDGLHEEKRIRQRAKIILTKLKNMHPQGKTLLDIGSGFGFFLDDANRSGFEAIGIEPAKKLAEYARKKYRLPVINQSIDDFKPTKKYDFITLIHVIEHFTDPISVIKKFKKLLNKDGILYIETPNLDSYLYRAEQRNYTFLTPPDHLFIFSQFSIYRLIEKYSDLQMLSMSTYSYPEHFMGIIKSVIKGSPSLSPHPYNFPALTRRPSHPTSSKLSNSLKYLIFDQFMAPIFTPLLNLFNYGSILQIYIKR